MPNFSINEGHNCLIVVGWITQIFHRLLNYFVLDSFLLFKLFFYLIQIVIF